VSVAWRGGSRDPRRRAPIRRVLASALLALLLAGAGAARAEAHATLESTTPERGAALARSPGEVVLRFSEPVEVAFGAVRVFDAQGRRVERGATFHPGGTASAVAVRLPPDLPDGGYTATYRVISADSHPVSGGFTFGVGPGAGAPSTEVADLLAGDDSGPVTAVAFSAVRAVQYGSIALGLGVLAVLLAAWLPGLRTVAEPGERWSAAAAAFDARASLLLLVAAAAGLASVLLGLVLQTAVAGGTTFWAAIGDTGSILQTRFGVVWGVGALAWAAVLVPASLSRAPTPRRTPAFAGRARLIAPGIPLLALAFLPALGGHAGVQDPVAALLPANVIHVLAASAWIGGLAALVVALPAATRRLEEGDRTRLLAAVLARFSTLALAAVAALLAGGILQSLLELSAVDDLWDTAFGRAILVKAGLVAALLALGFLNRRRILPALDRAASERAAPGRAGLLLRRSLRAEVALGAAALAATGALAGYTPGTAQSAGPFSDSADLGPAHVELTVDPARPGRNEAHLYLFSHSDGRQYDATRELRVTAALPSKGIAPIRLKARKAGPGHYVVSGAPLAPAGDWRLEVAARISEFDELRTTFTVPIR
jgi:copper transport protein